MTLISMSAAKVKIIHEWQLMRQHGKGYRQCRPVDGTSMNEECETVDAVQPQVDRQVCAMRFLT